MKGITRKCLPPSAVAAGVAALLGITSIAGGQGVGSWPRLDAERVQDVRVTLNGQVVRFKGAQPQTVDGRVLVPLRGIFEQAGAYVNWDPQQREVYASQGTREIRLRIGNRMAVVDGQPVTLDVPAMIVNGATMVPLRFLSESFGYQVRYDMSRNLVAIENGNPSSDGRAQPWAPGESNVRERPRERPGERERELSTLRLDLPQDTVVPVLLQTAVSSATAKVDDRVEARLDGESTALAGIPVGTKFVGKVVSVRKLNGDNPGLVEMDFQRMILPDGRRLPLQVTMVDLNDKDLKTEDGRIVATGEARNKRGVYAGYGAGAGFLVGLLGDRPVENAALGSILGYLIGSIERPERKPAEVKLAEGTRFGLRFDQKLTLNSQNRGGDD